MKANTGRFKGGTISATEFNAYTCNILTKKNVAAFCSCPDNFPNPQLKQFELISLAEEISRESEIPMNH